MANQRFIHAPGVNSYRIGSALPYNAVDRRAKGNKEILALFHLLIAHALRRSAFVFGTGIVVVLSVLALQRSGGKEQKPSNLLPLRFDVHAKDTGLAAVVRLAEAFKATLTEDQRKLVQLAYSKTDAAKWSNFPQAFSRPQRVGISLKQLTPAQLAAAKTLMASVLSAGTNNEGYDELQGILAADDYFGKTTGKTDVFGPGNYCLAFLGEPSTASLWELQFGGHHFAFANTYNGGKITGVTPSFRGVEPATAVKADGRTYQPLAQEGETFAKLIQSLSDAETSSAKLSNTFSDVLLGPGKDGMFPNAKQGLKVGALNSAGQKQVLKAIGLYVNDLDAATAKGVMAKYTAALAETYVAYSGSGTVNAANDYVRIDGPGVWIEYSVQPSRDFPGTTHPHLVWRDRQSDYGGN